MRALLNFQNRDGWSFHLLAEDCQTVPTKWRPIELEDALLGMIAKMHGDMAQAKNSISQWGRGSIWVRLSPAQCRFFGTQDLRFRFFLLAM
jgi:hypothetical protein